MKEAITFRDVLLVPKRSTIRSRKDVDTTGRFSRNLPLKCPIVSANMDTVTEAGMAIANGAEVIVVGDNPAFSTWQFHPSVSRAKSLSEAREILKVMQWKEQQQ